MLWYFTTHTTLAVCPNWAYRYAKQYVIFIHTLTAACMYYVFIFDSSLYCLYGLFHHTASSLLYTILRAYTVGRIRRIGLGKCRIWAIVLVLKFNTTCTITATIHIHVSKVAHRETSYTTGHLPNMPSPIGNKILTCEQK